MIEWRRPVPKELAERQIVFNLRLSYAAFQALRIGFGIVGDSIEFENLFGLPKQSVEEKMSAFLEEQGLSGTIRLDILEGDTITSYTFINPEKFGRLANDKGGNLSGL